MSKLLSEEFLEKYKNKQPNWGFNGLGYIVFKRTYAREVLGENRKEEWWETVRRCVLGAQEIGAEFTVEEAEFFYDSFFTLKCAPSGRFMWQAMTEIIKLIGGPSFLNCWHVDINSIRDFEFLMCHLSLGGGVGFSVERAQIHELPKIKTNVVITHKKTNDADFIVPDSRQGWVTLLRKVLKAYFTTGKSFSYSTILVRGYGAPLKTFGGTASGPEILVEGMSDICNILNNRSGKKMRSVDVLDVCNIIAKIIVAGSARRSATLAGGDPDDVLFLRAKNWAKNIIPAWRANSNNSIYADSYDEILDEFWKGYDGSGEPYGLLNRGLARKNGRLGEFVDDKLISGFNPCIIGESLVYVADGRGNVSIKQLAEEGKDVAVFCLDNKRNITIRTMRNPRKTGENEKIFKIILDDGNILKTTGNHKFKLTSGEYKEVKELKNGDSLFLMTREEKNLKDIFPKANSHSQNYYWLKTQMKPISFAEHRIVAEFFYNQKIPKNHIVHHKNYKSKDNHFENLQIMSKEDHDYLHSFDMIGDKNPMRRAKTEWPEEKWKVYRKKMSNSVSAEKNARFSGFSNEDIRNHAIILTKNLQTRFSQEDWLSYAKENGLPQNFSKWRKDHLGGIFGLSQWAAIECGIENYDLDPRTQKLFKDLLEQNYNCKIEKGEIFIKKSCEICSIEMILPVTRREMSICSLSCSNKKSWSNPNISNNRIEGIKKYNNERKEEIRLQQAKIYSDLKFKIGRNPFKKEWENFCRENNLSCEISRESSPFKSFKDLVEFSSTYNHKVVSVEEDGFEDVYNGTVDEFHNFFVGGFEGVNEIGKKKWSYFNNLQCGEIGLQSMECCNLSEIFLPNISSKEELLKISKVLYKVQKAITNLDFPFPETTEVVHKNRRLGQGITGWMQATQEQISWLNDCYNELKKFDIQWSKQHNINPSIKLSCTKPSGTLSLLSGVTPGIHPAFARYYIRRVRMGSNDPLIEYCKKLGYLVQYDIGIDGREEHTRVVISFPCEAPEHAVLAKDLTAIEQLEWVVKAQTIWADNAVSVTVYYKKEELEGIKEWLKENYKDKIKSVSFLLHNEHGFALAPYEEITKEEYHKMIKKLKPITSFSEVGEGNLENLECTTGACPIK